MNKKNKLMKALVGLELSNKAKQEFCDIVLSKDNDESGEGAGTESGSNIKYLNVQKVHETGMFDTVIAMMPGLLAVKAVGSDFTSIVPLSYLNKSYYNEITSVAILDDFQGLIELENNINSSEVIANCINNAGCFEITKEEFYNLEA